MADDYGNLVEGLLALHQATGEARWLHAADELLTAAIERFGDGAGIVRDTPADGERAGRGPDNVADNAEPSGLSALAGALLGYGALTGSTRHLDLADAALGGGGTVALRDPRFAGWTLAVAEAQAAGPLQVALVGRGDLADELVRVARASTSPGLVYVAGMPDAPGIPLLAGRPLVAGSAGGLRVPRVRLRPSGDHARGAAKGAGALVRSEVERLPARRLTLEGRSGPFAADEERGCPDVGPEQVRADDRRGAGARHGLASERVVQMCSSGCRAAGSHRAPGERHDAHDAATVARVLDTDPPGTGI